MAVTDGVVIFLVAAGLIYLTMYRNSKPFVRIMGCLAFSFIGYGSFQLETVAASFGIMIIVIGLILTVWELSAVWKKSTSIW